MQLSDKYKIYKQRVRDGQMGITPKFLDDISGSYGEAASLAVQDHIAVQERNYDGRMYGWGVLLTLLLFH